MSTEILKSVNIYIMYDDLPQIAIIDVVIAININKKCGVLHAIIIK